MSRAQVSGSGPGHTPAGELTRARASIAFAVVALAVVLPLAVAETPPLHDYPFHLAQIDILARHAASPFLQQHYQLNPRLLPNSGFDAMAVRLARFLPIDLAGRVTLAFLLVALLGGVVALNWTLARRRSAWPLVASLVLYNVVLRYGLVNYLAGVAVALWAAALQIRMLESRPFFRLLVGIPGALLVLFSHVLAFAVYAAFLGGVLLSRMRRRAGGSAIVELLALGLPIALAGLAFQATASAVSTQASMEWGGGTSLHRWKLLALLTPFRFMAPAADVALCLALGASLAALLATARPRVNPRARLGLLAIFLLTALAPSSLDRGTNIDLRTALPLCLFLVASIELDLTWPRAREALVALFAVLLAGRTAFLFHEFKASSAVLDPLRRSLSALPAGAVLFAATGERPPAVAGPSWLWRPPIKHAVSLASIGRDVLVAATWADERMHPFVPSPRIAPLYRAQGMNPLLVGSDAQLDRVAARLDALAAGRPTYLLVTEPGSLASRPALPTTLVAEGDRFRLIRLR